MFIKRLLLISSVALSIQSVAAQELLLAINEGVSYKDAGLASERYKPLIDLLEKELKRPVKVQKIDKYAELEKGLAEQKYDLAFIHPTHIALRGMKGGKYEGLATAKDFSDYRARIMVKKESSYKTIQDLRGKKIGVPAADSITTVLFTTYLRESGFSESEKAFSVTAYQDAVPFMIDNNFVEAGVTASAAEIKSWQSKGGRIIAETKPVPIKLFLGSRKLSDAERTKVQNLMLNLSESESGKAALAKIGMKGFIPWNETVMKEAGKHLGV